MRKPKVYIAGPYSGGDVAVNVRNAMCMWDDLYEAGFVPICPHLTHFQHMHKPRPYEEWLAYDAELIPGCDAMLRMRGLSSGADKEVEFAGQLGIPVFHSVAEAVAWKEAPDAVPEKP